MSSNTRAHEELGHLEGVVEPREDCVVADLGLVVVVGLAARGHVHRQTFLQEVPDVAAHRVGDAGEQVVHHELVGVAVEAEVGEELVSELDEHESAWPQQHLHVAQHLSVIAHVRHDAHRHERIVLAPAEEARVRGRILDVAPDDPVGACPISVMRSLDRSTMAWLMSKPDTSCAPLEPALGGRRSSGECERGTLQVPARGEDPNR